MGAKQTSKLTKHEAVDFLRKKLNVPEHFKKIFTKIWGASGKLVLHSLLEIGYRLHAYRCRKLITIFRHFTRCLITFKEQMCLHSSGKYTHVDIQAENSQEKLIIIESTTMQR